MMIINTYLNEEEYAYIKQHPKGYMRILVQNDMGPFAEIPQEKSIIEATPPSTPSKKKITRQKNAKASRASVVSKISSKGDGLHTCKKCGYMLPYYKGKCKNGCK